MEVHPLVTQLRFTRSEFLLGVKTVSDEDASKLPKRPKCLKPWKKPRTRQNHIWNIDSPPGIRVALLQWTADLPWSDLFPFHRGSMDKIDYKLVFKQLYQPSAQAVIVPLRKRMQEVSYFNFKQPDPALFAELAALTRAGFEHYQAAGYV